MQQHNHRLSSRRGACAGAVVTLLLAVAFGSCSPKATPAAPGARTQSRPNIVFLFSDDHAAHAVSAYGSRINVTPHIDTLADEGAIALNCFCGNSICAPSRATILTGLHSHANGQRTNRDRFDGSQTTFPKLLRDAGYTTALFGKWHLKSEPTGFDEWAVYPDQGRYYNPTYVTPDGPVEINGYSVEITADKGLEFLDRMGTSRTGKPFCLMLQFKAPHRNWMPGPAHLKMYDGVQIPEPDTLFATLDGFNRGVETQEMEIDRHMGMEYDLKVTGGGEADKSGGNWQRELDRLDPTQRAAWDAAYTPGNDAFLADPPTGEDLVRWKYQRYIKDYLRCVAAVDDAVGRVTAKLEELGLADNTIIVYSSDQGFYLGDNGWFDKRWMYEESLRMPFVVRWPAGGIRPGTRVTPMVQNIDFAPTFLDAAGSNIPETMHGRSMLPLLRGEQVKDWRDAIYYRYYESNAWHNVPQHFGVRTDRFKLIYYNELQEWEFFDLAEDPDEQENRYGQARYETEISRLRERLWSLQRAYGDREIVE